MFIQCPQCIKAIFPIPCEQKINKPKYTQAGTLDKKVDMCMTHKSNHWMLNPNILPFPAIHGHILHVIGRALYNFGEVFFDRRLEGFKHMLTSVTRVSPLVTL